MANRARDKVIYIRVDEALKKRFDRIKEASGYKGNADFLNYLLDVYGSNVTPPVRQYELLPLQPPSYYTGFFAASPLRSYRMQ